MMHFQHFFLSPSDGVDFVRGVYQPGLVFLSVFVAVVLSLMALKTAHIAKSSTNVLHRRIAIASGSVALGAGIWTMHFIGMLAFKLPAPVHYDTAITLLSLIPGWLGALVALNLLSLHRFSARQLAISGVLLGGGVGVMHYTGMMAMMTQLDMRYDPEMFVLSIVVAVVLAALALWIHFGLRAFGDRVRFWASGLIMGVAIAGMHYAGMAAVRYLGVPTTLIQDEIRLNTTYVALALSLLTLTVAIVVAALNGLVRSRVLYREIGIARSRLQAIFDTAVDAIITIDPYGTVQEFSHSAERLFGYPAGEVVGRNVKMLMPEPFHSQHDGYLKTYRDTQVPHLIGTGRELIGRRRDGSEFPIRLAVGRVDLPSDGMLFVGLIADISDRKALEATLRDSVRHAEQAAVAKGNFLANMSHEIRTPMNSIIGFTDLVLQTNLSPTQRAHLNTIRQSSRSLLRLINDILDTTKMENGRLELEDSYFSLKGLAFQIESSLRLGAHAKNLELTTHYPADMPEFFKGDQLRLLQILTNLVGNAIKFTETGSVRVDFGYDAGQVHLQVRDTGIGMTSEQMETIFKPFTQADASISRRFGGTGLGTTIAWQLTEIMGGHIQVESEFGQGSVFHVWLPLPPGQEPAAPEAGAALANLPALDVLIADDVPQNLDLLRLVLEKHGHRVVSAVDGDEAYEKYQAAHFDLILMDVHMPGTDGRQATRLIRQYERTDGLPYTPIIALTASVMASDRREARQAGMDGFAVKPLEVARLFEEMARVLTDLNAPSVVERPGPSPTMSSAIDWDRGMALWDNRAALAARIVTFVDGVGGAYPLPDPAQGAADAAALAFSLHGIRGAAGNLAMMAVSRLAGELEGLCREGRVDAALPRLSSLSALLLAARQAAQAEAPGEADDVEAGFLPASQPGDAPPVADLPATLEMLLPILARNELDDAALAQVCRQLIAAGRRDHAQALRLAVDGFDFARACMLLRGWLAEQQAGLRADDEPTAEMTPVDVAAP